MEGKLFKEFKKGAISEKAFKEILLRHQKLPEDPDPMQDLKNWFATKYIKENMKEDSFVSAHFCVDVVLCFHPAENHTKIGRSRDFGDDDERLYAHSESGTFALYRVLQNARKGPERETH